jgi:hypothetical protein
LNLTCAIDTTGLNKGIALGVGYSKRTPAQMCDTAAMVVAVETQKATPFTDQGLIDSQLFVDVAPKIGVRGKPLKGKFQKISKPGTATGANATLPLAVLIIQSRANPGSQYNLLTGGRFSGPSPFKGLSRAAGAAAMRQAVHDMIAGRHSSTHFMKAGLSQVIKDLRPYSVLKYSRRSLDNADVDGGDKLSKGTPATQGSTNTFTTIESDIGLEGANAKANNEALWRVVAPRLQQAVDTEGVAAMKYFYDKSAAAELYSPVNKAWS